MDCALIPLLKVFAPWERIQWIRTEDGVVFFEAEQGDVRRKVAVCFFVRKEESDVWKACHAMVAEAVRLAAGWVQGLYGFEMIAMELDQGIRHFRLGDLGQLLANHARQMAVGESRLIRYGGLWGVFKKRIPESYGKIEFKSIVKICAQEAERFDLYLGGLKRKAQKFIQPDGLESLLVCDLSAERLLNLNDASQQEKLLSFYKKIEKEESSAVCFSKIHYRHEREELSLWARELSQF